jgi:hypothetical protein
MAAPDETAAHLLRRARAAPVALGVDFLGGWTPRRQRQRQRPRRRPRSLLPTLRAPPADKLFAPGLTVGDVVVSARPARVPR